MMRSRWTITYVAGWTGCILAGCTSVEDVLSLQRPTAQLVGVQLTDASLTGATLVFDVAITNHYPFNLPLLSFNYGLSSFGQRFLAGSSGAAGVIPAGGSMTIALPARVDYLRALNVLTNVRPGARIPYEAELDLLVHAPQVGSITLPLVKDGALTLPTFANVNLGNILGATKMP